MCLRLYFVMVCITKCTVRDVLVRMGNLYSKCMVYVRTLRLMSTMKSWYSSRWKVYLILSLWRTSCHHFYPSKILDHSLTYASTLFSLSYLQLKKIELMIHQLLVVRLIIQVSPIETLMRDLSRYGEDHQVCLTSQLK